MNRFALIILALLTAGSLAYRLYRQHIEYANLNAQLSQLDCALAVDNEDAARRNESIFKGIEAGVRKNQRQPTEVTVWQTATAWHTQADSLVSLLHACADSLIRMSRYSHANSSFPHPNAVSAVNQLLGASQPAQQLLQQHLTNFQAFLRSNGGDTGQRLGAPLFDGLPVTAALASLTALESDVRAVEQQSLKRAARRIRSVPFLPMPMVFSSAESNTVASGEIYRAHLMLVNTLDVRQLRLQMRCNGRPIPLDSNHVGQVRFVAPQQLGPATWTGTIRFDANGRDTTFQVLVPYRVIRR